MNLAFDVYRQRDSKSLFLFTIGNSLVLYCIALVRHKGDGNFRRASAESYKQKSICSPNGFLRDCDNSSQRTLKLAPVPSRKMIVWSPIVPLVLSFYDEKRTVNPSFIGVFDSNPLNLVDLIERKLRKSAGVHLKIAAPNRKAWILIGAYVS